MAYYKFTRAIMDGDPIDVYNNGDMKRDFTYIDDIIEGVVRIMDKIPAREQSTHSSVEVPYRLYNIGNNHPVTLMSFIEVLEACCRQKAKLKFLPMQPGDVPATWANSDLLKTLTGYRPQTDFRDGIARFVEWYREYSMK